MSFFKRESAYFYTALQFYTRIPIPSTVQFTEENQAHSSRYFPLIGIIIGVLSALSFYLFKLAFDPLLALLLSLFVSVLLTGALHEDGLADVCDGFGGGNTKEKILEIMRDSRIGTYGLIGLLLAITIKVSALNEFALLDIPFMIICGHSISRFAAISFLYTHEYSGTGGVTKSESITKKITKTDLVIAAVFGILPLLCFLNPWIFLVIIPVYLSRLLLASMFVKWIGGFTGDCLGATQQVTEIIFYLSAIIVLRFLPWN